MLVPNIMLGGQGFGYQSHYPWYENHGTKTTVQKFIHVQHHKNSYSEYISP